MKLHIIVFIIFTHMVSMSIAPAVFANNDIRFIDNGDGTVTDTATGLMWQKFTPSPLAKPAVTWLQAKKECASLDFAGYNDWRLPTVEEWWTIIDTRNEYPALVMPNPFQDVIVHSPYWTGTEYTYGSTLLCDSDGCPLHAHVVLLYLGHIGQQRKDRRAFTWPVRSAFKPVRAPVVPATVKQRSKQKVKAIPLHAYQGVAKVVVRAELLSRELELLGFNKEAQINLDSYLQMPVNKNSKAKIRSIDGGIESVFNLYKIDRNVVELFNNNAEQLGLSVRVRFDSKRKTVIFY